MAAEEAAAKRPRTTLPVVLGSSSKFRRDLFLEHFAEYGQDFLAPDIDEKAIRADSPEAMTVAIASAKADALLPRLAGRDVLVVCMDQVVSCAGEVREKPDDEAVARRYLDSYRSGNGATCINGMVVHNTRTGKRVTGVDRATIYWRHFPDSVVDALIARKEVFTSAGGFIMEDPDLQAHQERLEGTADSIRGLPVKRLRSMLLHAEAPPVTHVLFDMDGLLLDTENAYSVAQQRTLDRFGKKFTWEVKAKMMGKKALDAVQVMITELSLEGLVKAEELIAERDAILDQLFPQSNLLPGVERLVRHLHKHGVPMAVATSSFRKAFELKTQRHKELFGLMKHVVTGDQVANSKPHPEIFLKAAGLFEGGAPDAARVLVFEDASAGVQAARAAGMQVCHVPDENLGEDHRGGAHCELPSLELFRPEDWGLPPF